MMTKINIRKREGRHDWHGSQINWNKNTWRIDFGPIVFNLFGVGFAPITEMVLMLAVLWLFTCRMYRRKLFLKI